jgi:hypothetical protein
VPEEQRRPPPPWRPPSGLGGPAAPPQRSDRQLAPERWRSIRKSRLRKPFDWDGGGARQDFAALVT